MPPEDPIPTIWKWLRTIPILDNAFDEDLCLSKYFPFGPRGDTADKKRVDIVALTLQSMVNLFTVSIITHVLSS